MFSGKNLPLLFRDERQAYGNATFDVIILVLITLSAALFITQSYVNSGEPPLWSLFLDSLIMILFSMELFLRNYYAKDRAAYFFSLSNIIDTVAVVPFWIGVPSLQFLRAFRFFRFFRFFDRYISKHPANARMHQGSLVFKIVATFLVFLYISASVLYTFEKEANDRVSSFGDAVYLAVVTATTVGFGDIVPVTPEGKVTIVVIISMSIFLIPVYLGSLIKLFVVSTKRRQTTCKSCGLKFHDYNAVHCKMCGEVIYQEFDDENSG